MEIKTLNRYPTFERTMLTRYWQPLREVGILRRDFDRMFNDLSVPVSSGSIDWTPAIELNDTGDNLVLRAVLPGIDVKDVNIQVTNEAVLLSGEHHYEQKTEDNKLFKSEFRYGKFQRVIPLPVAIINDQVQAEYKDGILTLTLPKVVEEKNKVVKINLADLNQANATA
jgi:HSP20 family protein